MLYLANLICFRPTEDARFIAEQDDDEFKAIGIYDNYNGRSIHSHIWIADGYRPSRVFWWAMHDYPFHQLAVTNIIATVASSNKTALRLVRHLGYKYVAMVPDYYETGDDQMIYVGLEENATHWHKYQDGRAAPPTYLNRQLIVA